MRLGGGFGSGETKEADLEAACGLNDIGGVEGKLAVIADVADHFELGVLGDRLEVCIAVVKLMVAEGCDVVTGSVHELDRGLALRIADIGLALDVVAGVHKNDVSALGLIILFQGCDLCVQAHGAVHVVGVQDDRLACEFSLCCEGRGHKTKDHQDSEEKRY